MIVRAAEPHDAASIVALIRAPFDPAIIETFTYGCSGIARYIAATIEERGAGPDTRYFVAGDDVRGAIEMRILVDALFLNYIAVDGTSRGQHLGSRLLAHAIDELATPAHTQLSLDVLETNEAARTWYAKLGMNRVARAIWFIGSVPASPSHSATIAGLPQARVSQREFGFSRVSITCTHGTHDVGMLGERWFRVTAARSATDECVMAALHHLDPRRQLLVIVPEGHQVPAYLERFVAMDRMSGPLKDVRQALSSSLAGAA